MITRKRRSTEYVSPTCPPGWAWLLAGILIGIFISFLFYLREIAPQSLPPENALLPPPTENVSSVDNKSEPTDFILFDDSEKPTAKDENKGAIIDSNPNTPITTPGRYLLQVGSFQKEQGAEGLKAYLNSLDVPAFIKKKILNGKWWYIVQIGPFSDLNKLNQIRHILAANNVRVLLRKF